MQGTRGALGRSIDRLGIGAGDQIAQPQGVSLLRPTKPVEERGGLGQSLGEVHRFLAQMTGGGPVRLEILHQPSPMVQGAIRRDRGG